MGSVMVRLASVSARTTHVGIIVKSVLMDIMETQGEDKIHLIEFLSCLENASVGFSVRMYFIFRNGARCYLKCEGRTILGNIKHGALGTHAGQGVANTAHAYCLWILTVHPDLTNLRLINVVPTISFTMQTDIKTRCSRVNIFISVFGGAIFKVVFNLESV